MTLALLLRVGDSEEEAERLAVRTADSVAVVVGLVEGDGDGRVDCDAVREGVWLRVDESTREQVREGERLPGLGEGEALSVRVQDPGERVKDRVPVRLGVGDWVALWLKVAVLVGVGEQVWEGERDPVGELLPVADRESEWVRVTLRECVGEDVAEVPVPDAVGGEPEADGEQLPDPVMLAELDWEVVAEGDVEWVRVTLLVRVTVKRLDALRE